jgi:23S rRNA (uracil1939-C5)-methyltransferase
MARKKKTLTIIENLRIEKAASQGKSLGKHNDKVVFVSGVVPGDLVDVQVTKKRKSYLEAKAIKIHEYSEERSEPFCSHFGVCGGCKWQNMQYQFQLKYKEQQVIDQFTRLGDLEVKEWLNIIPAPETKNYRNKLEFTFSNRKWLTLEEIRSDEEISDRNGLGFHIPGAFDKVVDLKECHLQGSLSNDIRLFVKEFTSENNYTYFDLRDQHGLLRNLMIRNSTIGEVMVVVVFYENDKDKIQALLTAIKEKFPEVSSLMYVLNEKKNDSLFDQDFILFSGKDHIIEQLGELQFKIGPKSFFQTNSKQANSLYNAAIEFAAITDKDIVYDLYSGTGTISNIVARKAKKVIGVEQIEEAVLAARENSKLNEIENTTFYAGDTKDVLNKDFFKKHGRPDVIIVDPPRAGLHEKVVMEIIKAAPERFVYISCNPATQARDLALMKEEYKIEKVQAVDMFPQTHHVENIAYLVKRSK